ncbi:MAG: hypothetical protein K9L21_02440 [Spirochaetia bacterium]|nr:hypothetical protein [Spirochaetia bacterium]
MSTYVVGVDLGTSGIKAGVVDSTGELLSEVYWDTQLVAEGPGRMQQSPDDFLRKTLDIMKEAVAVSGIDPQLIAGMAIDGQMGGIIGIDESYNAVTGLDMGLDIRSERYNKLLHQMLKNELVSISCGSPRNTPKMMMWKREYPSVYKKIRKFVTLGAYVTGKIANLEADKAFIDYTSLAFFGNENAESLTWSEELTKACELDLPTMPNILSPWEQIGSMSKYAAEKANLRQGLPVFAGIGDQPAGFLGAGFTEKGQLLDVSGSTTLLCCTVDTFRPDKKNKTVMYMPSAISGKYIAFTYINGGGISLKWFSEEITSEKSLKDLSDIARQVPPGAEGLLFYPYLGGRQCPYDDAVRGAWLGLNWGHTKAHMYRAMLEGLGIDYALGVEAILSVFPDIHPESIYAIGGGVKDGLWNAVKADILNRGYRVLPDRQYALLGSGLVALKGLGVFNDFSDVPRILQSGKFEKEYIPDNNNAILYKRYIKLFKNILKQSMRESMEQLQIVN